LRSFGDNAPYNSHHSSDFFRSEVIIIDHSSDGNLYDYVQELRKIHTEESVDLFIDVLSILFVGCYILLGGFTEKSLDVIGMQGRIQVHHFIHFMASRISPG
jgi:hypothetical protein